MNSERNEFEVRAYKKEFEPTQRRVIALEGPVCAGKTTVLEKLRAGGNIPINEYSEYVQHANSDFPPFPPSDQAAAEASFKFFFDLEAKRRKDFDSQPEGTVVLDRSIYTLLAFEVGASRLTGIDILPWAINFLDKHKDEIIIPEQVIYMDVPVEISRARSADGNIPIAGFLLTDEFNQGYRDFFLALKENAPELVSIVDATKSEDVTMSEVSSSISS